MRSLAALKGEKTLVELAEQLVVRPDQITRRRTQLIEDASSIFGGVAYSQSETVRPVVSQTLTILYNSGQRKLLRLILSSARSCNVHDH